jgi:hypothetical protein
MRTIVSLSLIAIATADVSLKDQAHCVVDGGEAASDLMDAAIFIWGAKQRCTHQDNQIKCEIDIASAVQSIASMTNTILKVVGRCGKHFDPDCGRASTRLVKAVAGVSAASGGIKQKCHPDWKQPVAGGAMVGGNLPGTDWMHGASALCVLDVKNSAKNLLKVVKSFVKINKKCKHKKSRKCSSNALKLMGALSGLGEYLAASIGDCSPATKMSHDAECAQENIMLVHSILRVAEAGTEISKKCATSEDHDDKGDDSDNIFATEPNEPWLVNHGDTVEKADEEREIHARAGGNNVVEVPVVTQYVLAPRLYEKDGDKSAANAGFANIVLGAFLPVTAIVSFVAGRFYSNHRARAEQTREFMSDNE